MKRQTVTRKALLANGDDGAFRAFVHDLLTFGARLETVRAGFGRRLGLSGTGYTCLMAIAYLQGAQGVGVNGVAKHLHLSPAFITLEVAKLVDRGLIVKRTNSEDRRRVLLTLSANGLKSLTGLTALQAPVNDALFGCLDDQDFAYLRRLMPKLVRCSEDAVVLLAGQRPARKPSLRE